MLFEIVSQLEKREALDVLVLPFWEKGGKEKADKAIEAVSVKEYTKQIKHITDTNDFSGKECEAVIIYPEEGKEKRLLLIGLGKEENVSIDVFRKAAATAIRLCHKKKLKKINFLVPTLKATTYLQGIVEGILLSNYKWSLRARSDESSLIEQVTLLGVKSTARAMIDETIEIAEGVYLARDLINGNADDVTPKYLAETAKGISKQFPDVKTTVWNKKEIEKEKMGLLYAVGKGSPNEPAFITMQYNGNPKSKDKSVLIGKGVTFDTGGLNLKPTGSMETMRDDMSGAAAVIGILAVVAALKLKVNVCGVIPTAENAIDGHSFKPGDVYTSYSGKTVEIGNTDAEGRLILADAISYAVKHLSPTRIIDFATLTGAMVIALGDHVSGVFTNDDKLNSALHKASAHTSELVWRLPLHAPYKELLKSDIADIKNIGGRAAGSITAALFLEEFVNGIPWAHIDIAGTAFSSKEEHYIPKNGVGFGVRLIVEFLKQI